MSLRRFIWLCLTAVLLFGLCACSSAAPETSPDMSAAEAEALEPAEVPKAPPAEPRIVPFQEAVFHEDLAEGIETVKVDLSAVSEGYIAISGTSETRLKVQVTKDEETYTYDLSTDGTPSIFPLQCGDGSYSIRIMENVVDSKYAELYSTSCDVTLKDEFQPFLRPNDYVNYQESSRCVVKAAEISGGAEDELDVVTAVYDYICDNIVYDNAKAETVASGYMPTPDETLSTGCGICFDYASLAAAMLRSQGIPTKVVFGYVSPDDLYHAWNMFYTDESGWVSVSFEVDQNAWNRLDLTFSASGAGNDFIGDGSNYADLYHY